MTRPLRIGILGAARISKAAIVGPAQVTGHRLVAVAARNQERAKRFAAEHGVERVLSDYAELVADADLDVIYNPLANALHGPWKSCGHRGGQTRSYRKALRE